MTRSISINSGLEILFKLQLAYASAGILFNLTSLWRVNIGLKALTETKPLLGILMMALVACSAWAGCKAYLKTFTVMNCVLILPLLIGGVLKHFAFNTTFFMANAPLVLAISINMFGVTVMAISLICVAITLKRKT